MNARCRELLAKRTNKYEKTVAEFVEIKGNFSIVKFRRAKILERLFLQTTKGRSAHCY